MTRKVDTYMPLFVGDYRRDTSRLTTEQHGAYILLIIDYWTQGPPPNDDAVLAQIVLQDVRGWRRLRPHLERFFQIDEGFWRHKRIEEELQKARARRDVAAENGARGGRPPKQTITAEKPSGLTEAKAKPNPQESSSPSTSSLRSEGEEPLGSSTSSLRSEVEKPPGSSQPPKRGRRIPDDWMLTDEDHQFAAKEGMSPEEIGRAADEFRDYWRARAGRDACKLDWSATFRNRIREIANRKRERSSRMAFAPGKPNGGGSGARSIADIVLGPGAAHGAGGQIP